MRPHLLLVALLGAGCGDLDLDFSSDGTAVTATARGDGTVEVWICAGPRDLLSCDDATRFTVAMGDQVVDDEMIASQLFGSRLAHLEERPGATLVVTRGDGATMSVELPPPFALTAPAAGATVSRRDGVTLRWSPGAGDVTWMATGTCDGVSTALSGDAGDDRVTLRGDDLPELASGACDVELTIEHRRAGRVGRGFPDDSHIHGVQARTVRVRLVP